MAPADALAAGNAPAGNDGIFVWIFLGFLALIIVGQLIPAIMLLIGLVKGLVVRSEAKTEAR